MDQFQIRRNRCIVLVSPVRNRGLCISHILIVLLGVVHIFGKAPVTNLKLWQHYVDNEQSLATARIMSDNGFSLTAVIHGLYNLTRFYSTCPSQAIQFNHTVTQHFIWTVCSDLQVYVLSSADAIEHRLEIRMPRAFAINITVLTFHSDFDTVTCFDKLLAIPLVEKLDFDIICGNPYLGRTSIISYYTNNLLFLYRRHAESVLHINLHIQAIAYVGRSKGHFLPEVASDNFPPILQSFNGKNYVTKVVILTAVVDLVAGDWVVAVENFITRVNISSSYCSTDVLDVFAVYDGPYAGVLSTRGLISPFQLLMEGTCLDVPTGGYLSYEASIGDLTVVVRHSQHYNTTLICQFETGLPAQCPGEWCRAATFEVTHDKVQIWSFVAPSQPLIQMVTFVTKTPNSYIKLKVEVLEANVPHSKSHGCSREGIYMYEVGIVSYVCSDEGFSILNRSMEETGGLQFNTIPVTIVLKIYPQTTKLRLNIWYTGKPCFGIVNRCFFAAESVFEDGSIKNGLSSCLPVVLRNMYVYLKPNCCIQWHLIKFDDTRYSILCKYEFYAPKNSFYKWHIDFDDNLIENRCFDVRYGATDYPLMDISDESIIPSGWNRRMVRLEKNTTLSSTYLGMSFLVFPEPGCIPFRTGIRITGMALSFTELSRCNNESIHVSHTESKTHESDITVSFNFEPSHRCAALHLPRTSTQYFFNFNLHKGIIEVHNSIYTLKVKSMCCFIHLVLWGSPGITEEHKDQFRYAVPRFDSRDYQFVVYRGIPQSLVLRDFSVLGRNDGFTIRKSIGQSSVSIEYHIRERNKLHRYTMTGVVGSADDDCTMCTTRKCYCIHPLNNISWNEADMVCRRKGYDLINLNDQYEWYHIAHILQYYNSVFLPLGLKIKVGHVVKFIHVYIHRSCY